jgi:phosphate-selective porin
MEPTTLIQTGELDDAPNCERYEVQALFIKAKWLLEAHFLGASVNTEKTSSFNGFWGQVSYQIIGDQQKYNKVTGLPITSAPGTLEVLGRFDYLNLDNFGKQTDFEFGLNYIINKHFNVKFNYVVATGKDRPDIQDDRTLHLIQTRLQFTF